MPTRAPGEDRRAAPGCGRLAVLVALGLLIAPGGHAGARHGRRADASPGTAAPTPSCDYLGLQCGSLLVPLDHADPTAPRSRLALTRRPHTASTYRGVDAGQPGRSRRLRAVSMPALERLRAGQRRARATTGSASTRAASAPARRRCTARGATSPTTGPNYVPQDGRAHALLAGANRAYAAACANTAAKRALLPHLTTLDTVRDMELIRQALGESDDQLLRLLLRHLPRPGLRDPLPHPGGPVRPRRRGQPAAGSGTPPTSTRTAPSTRNMNVFWRYLASAPARLPPRQALARRSSAGYYRQLRQLDRKPAAGGRLGPDELADAMLDAGYYVYNWVELGQAYSALVRKRPRWRARRRSTATPTWATTTASRCTTPCSAPTRRGPAGSRTRRRRSWVGAPARAVPDLGEHLVQRARA